MSVIFSLFIFTVSLFICVSVYLLISFFLCILFVSLWLCITVFFYVWLLVSLSLSLSLTHTHKHTHQLSVCVRLCLPVRILIKKYFWSSICCHFYLCETAGSRKENMIGCACVLDCKAVFVCVRERERVKEIARKRKREWETEGEIKVRKI
jgi:hypothetical protein